MCKASTWQSGGLSFQTLQYLGVFFKARRKKKKRTFEGENLVDLSDPEQGGSKAKFRRTQGFRLLYCEEGWWVLNYNMHWKIRSDETRQCLRLVAALISWEMDKNWLEVWSVTYISLAVRDTGLCHETKLHISEYVCASACIGAGVSSPIGTHSQGLDFQLLPRTPQGLEWWHHTLWPRTLSKL